MANPTKRIYVTPAEHEALRHAAVEASENAIEWPETWATTRDGLHSLLDKLDKVDERQKGMPARSFMDCQECTPETGHDQPGCIKR